MSSESLIPRIDCRQSDASGLFRQLRQKLSPRGDVVSESGRQRTLELFGEALSPREVVRRICEDVRRDGLGSVLDYTLKLDRVQL
ncbi:MAG: histidinol dehydrogenase, partial [Planctomycetaceae bacterium]